MGLTTQPAQIILVSVAMFLVKHSDDVMAAEETKDTQKLLTRRRCWVLCVVRSQETLLE